MWTSPSTFSFEMIFVGDGFGRVIVGTAGSLEPPQPVTTVIKAAAVTIEPAIRRLIMRHSIGPIEVVSDAPCAPS